MPRQSILCEVLIASPNDVREERTVLSEVLQDWNSAHSRASGISLQVLRWELDVVPGGGDRPQQIINKQLVENADILMAVFWTRLGTPTGKAPSGTLEEIEQFRQQGKPVLLYFSEEAIPHNHDPDQFRALKEYRETLANNTLYGTFRTVEELRRHASKDIARVIHDLAPNGSIAARSQSTQVGAEPKNKNEFARLLLRQQNMSQQGLKVVRVFGTIENTSQAKRIREYSVTLAVPSPCLTFNNATLAREIRSTQANYRKVRGTEANQNVAIHTGDVFQIISLDIAVDHLSQDEREKCLQMDVIADAVVDGEALQVRKQVQELFTSS